MKKGISLVILVVTIIVMIILAGTVLVTSFDSVQLANIERFATELINVQNGVDEYYFKYNEYPRKDTITFNTSNIATSSLNQFSSETINSGNIDFYTVDLAKIGISNTDYGENKNEYDVYVVSASTGIVYNLQGEEYEDVMYYTLTEKLYEISGIYLGIVASDYDIKEQDIVFRPSSVDFTNKPIEVLVKIPRNATINSIFATNSKVVSEVQTVGGIKQVTVNNTGTYKDGNYEITVNYKVNESIKQVNYKVNNFDNIKPSVTYQEDETGEQNVVTLTVTDTGGSGIDIVKYEEATGLTEDYFKYSGKVVEGNNFIIEKNKSYTIYAKDKAGNVTLAEVTK